MTRSKVVFVVEQEWAFLDVDGLDTRSIHRLGNWAANSPPTPAFFRKGSGAPMWLASVASSLRRSGVANASASN